MNMTSMNQSIGSELHFKVLEDTSAIEQQSRGPHALPSFEAPPQILVVEDEVAIQKMIKRSLEIQIGAEITLASHGLEAIAQLQKKSFDLIISDMQMPQMSGLELYEWIRIQSNSHTDRFFIISGDLGSQTAAEEFHRYGVEVIRKPFHISFLKNKALEYLYEKSSVAA